MKETKSITLLVCLASLPMLTGCPGGGGGSNNNNNNNGPGNPPPSGGNAPSSLYGKTITVNVTGGARPFASSGSYTITLTGGNGNSGTYSLSGAGGVQSNIGTYNYSGSGNTGNFTEVEQSSTLVNNTLTFTSANGGTIYSSSPPGNGPVDVGGYQTGTFTIN